MSSYPTELEAIAALPSGKPLRIRSIRPEDEALLVDMVARMTADDLRLRFFATMKGLSHELAVRLTDIDPRREVALIAEPTDRDEILGVARFSAAADNREAEFAVTVRSDWKGHGIGWMLMQKLIDAARERGVDMLKGQVLRANGTMLRFCRDIGFAITENPDDPQTCYASLTLSR